MGSNSSIGSRRPARSRGRTAARFREDAGAREALDEVAERARTLREWLRGFVARHAGREIGRGSRGGAGSAE